MEYEYEDLNEENDDSEEIILLASDGIGERIDVFINSKIEGYSRNFFKNLIDEGNVTVNTKQVKSNYKLKPNDEITVKMPLTKEEKLMAEYMPLNIIFEDEDILIINKEKGIITHPASNVLSGTLANGLKYYLKDNLSDINGELRQGIVHRIDKDTSGILICAKNNFAHENLAIQFADRSALRKYEAIACGKIKQDQFEINAAIGRGEKERTKMQVNTQNAKEAITKIKVLEAIGKYTYLEAQLLTGRTHQIRVHLSHKGYPIIGDTVYGLKKQPFKINGQALFAKTIGFIHPRSKEYMEFSIEPPTYFTAILSKLRNMDNGN